MPPGLSIDVGLSRFTPVMEFIEESLDRDVGLFELASLVGLSTTRFSHAFKAAYGVAPYRYILQRRVERAKRLLRITKDSVTTIASRVGFASQSRFARTFATATGMTPSAYRSEISAKREVTELGCERIGVELRLRGEA